MMWEKFPGRGLLEAVGFGVPFEDEDVLSLAHLSNVRLEGDVPVLALPRKLMPWHEEGLSTLYGALTSFESRGVRFPLASYRSKRRHSGDAWKRLPPCLRLRSHEGRMCHGAGDAHMRQSGTGAGGKYGYGIECLPVPLFRGLDPSPGQSAMEKGRSSHGQLSGHPAERQNGFGRFHLNNDGVSEGC